MRSPDPNTEDPDDELSTQPTGLAEHAAQHAPVVETGPPQLALFPMRRYTLAMRRAALASGAPLAPVMRVPTLRSLSYHVQQVLQDSEQRASILSFRDDDLALTSRIAHKITGLLVAADEPARRGLIARVVRETLGRNRRSYYSLEATAKRLGPLDYEECCALDHYTAASYGKRIHAYVIYRYMQFLRKKAVLPPADAMETCSVCQHRAAARADEGGSQVLWCQAEPCRHWSCDECTGGLISRGMGGQCALCRGPVHSYALGIAPAGNQ